MPEEINKILQKHFDEDETNFKKLRELCSINGEHLSYFNKNLEEVKAMLNEQNKINLDQQKILTEHIQRVEPMLKAYEKDTEFNKIFGEKAKTWSVRVGMLASCIGAFYVIKAFIANLLK